MARIVRSYAMALVVLCGAAWTAEAREELPRLPQGICALVEIKDTGALSQQLQAFASSIGAGQVAVGPLLQMGLAKALKTTNPTVVDWGSPLRVVVTQAPIKPAVVFRVTDADSYLSSLLPGIEQKGQEGEVRLYEGQADIVGEKFAVGVVGKQIVLALDAETAQAAVALVKGGKLSVEAILPGEGVSAVVEGTRLLDGVTQTTGDPFDLLRGLIASPQFSQPMKGTAGGTNIKAILDAEVDAAESLAKQIETVMVTVGFGAERMRIKLQLRATDGGGVSRYMASVPAGEPKVLKYMPADAWFVVAAKMGDLRPLMDWGFSLMEKVVPAGTDDAQAIKEMMQAAQQMLSAYGNEVAFALTSAPGQPMALTEVIQMKDPKSAAEAMAKIGQLMVRWMGLMTAPGLQMKSNLNPSAETYKGHDIAEWKMSFDFQVPEGVEGARAEELKKMLKVQKEMFERMYGPEMVMHYGFSDNDWLVTMGKDSLGQLKKLLDGQVVPISESPAFQAALSAMPKERTGVWYLSLGDLANWYLGVLEVVFKQADNPMMATIGPILANIKFERGPGVMATSLWSGRTVVYNVVVPSAEIAGLVQGVQKAMMQMQMQMQQTR